VLQARAAACGMSWGVKPSLGKGMGGCVHISSPLKKPEMAMKVLAVALARSLSDWQSLAGLLRAV